MIDLPTAVIPKSALIRLPEGFFIPIIKSEYAFVKDLTLKEYNQKELVTEKNRLDSLFDVSVFLLRHEDLKQMLDSTKDGLKLEAMKRIIGVRNKHAV